MSEQETFAQTWRALAQKTVRKVNFGWWLHRFSPLLVMTALIAAVAIVLLRTFAPSAMESPWPGTVGGILLAASGLAAWLMARRRFLKGEDGLVRLEDRLRLHNALTTAERGVGPWPAAPTEAKAVDAGLRWNWWWVATPFAIALLSVAAAILIPITSVEAAKAPPSEPLAWAQMEEWMDLLAEEDLIEEQAIEEVKEKIDELRQQPEDEWFTHSSLEASDTMRQTLQQQIRNMGAELANAERDLNALENYGSQLSDEAKDKLMAEYDQALQNLALSGLPLNPELMNSLKGIDPKQLAQGQMSGMTAEQMAQLREALQKAAQACSQCNGTGNGEGLPALGEGDAALMALLKQGQGPGKGGITRGPGTAPLTLGAETDLKTNQIEGVQNPDFSRAAPGDVLGIGQTEHDIDETKTGPVSAGAVGSIGQGGETIWKESLMPGEKAVLKRYFK